MTAVTLHEFGSSQFRSNSIIAGLDSSCHLRAAWNAVLDNQLSLFDACSTAITTENCSSSLDEWCIAHDLLMRAVRSGEIPASRHFEGHIAHWHSVLYQHCSKLIVSGQGIGFIKPLVMQAEDAGVIAVGSIESLISVIGVRMDMEKDNRFLVNALYQIVRSTG